MSNNDSDNDSTNIHSQPTTSGDPIGDDEIDFQLDIADGEDPGRPVTDENEFNPYPPGPGPFLKRYDSSSSSTALGDSLSAGTSAAGSAPRNSPASTNPGDSRLATISLCFASPKGVEGIGGGATRFPCYCVSPPPNPAGKSSRLGGWQTCPQTPACSRVDAVSAH